MGVLAVGRYYSTNGSACSRKCGMVGALSFIVSDSILAVNKFVVPIPLAKPLVMVTYYLGQHFIAKTQGSESQDDKKGD